MLSINRRAAGFAVLGLIVTALAACGDSEADQRAAFIKFLQTINHRTGVHFLKPNDADIKAFGDYLHHYSIITTFNSDMGNISKDFNARVLEVTGGHGSQSIEQMAANRDKIAVLKGDIGKLQERIDKRLAEIRTERAGLKQPDDLKAVYDITFEKLIVKPTLATKNHLSALDNGLGASLQLADYINTHAGQLTVKGSQVLAKDSKTLDEIKGLLAAQNAATQQIRDAGREMDRLMDGS
jgi:hypothetical protein